MTLAIFNGSPRGTKSNSKILIEHFLAGYRTKNIEENVNISYIKANSDHAENIEIFRQADKAIIIFPLYTDCMPAMVKEFLEQLYEAKGNKPRDLGFIVQSGFPEAIHSVYVERYLAKFTRRMGCNYLGTVIKGGVEGIQVMPPSMTKKLFNNFRQLGSHFAETGEFSAPIMDKLKGPLRMSDIKFAGFKLLAKTGLLNFYWNNHLKKYGAFEKRFDQPFYN
jgi:NAD(P)H-dependent FMN reductase